jgi:hypothetical protein
VFITWGEAASILGLAAVMGKSFEGSNKQIGPTQVGPLKRDFRPIALASMQV